MEHGLCNREDSEGRGSALIWCAITTFVWRHWRRPRRTTNTIAGCWAWIRLLITTVPSLLEVGSRVVLIFSNMFRNYEHPILSARVTHARKHILGLYSIGEYALPCPGVHDAKNRWGTSAKQSKRVMPSTILHRIVNGEERNLDLQNTFFITCRLAVS
jgi:hypothetical protein